jgi:hypothetical protein
MPSALDLFGQDVRYAIRGLIRNPAFALTAILAASLGIDPVASSPPPGALLSAV